MNEQTQLEFIKGQFCLIQHYSNLLFKARVSMITLLVVLWAVILGVGTSVNVNVYRIFIFDVPSKSLLALIGSILLLSLAAMELAYTARFYNLHQSIRLMESVNERILYFRIWRPYYMPFYIFYISNHVLLLGVFASSLISYAPSITKIVCVIVIFALFAWLYWRSICSVRQIIETHTPKNKTDDEENVETSN